MREYYKYWGKAKKPESGKDGDASYHLLVYHCLDVAAVAYNLLEPKTRRCKDMALHTGLSPELVQYLIVISIMLHDIGKFSKTFQALVPELFQQLFPGCKTRPYNERHDTLGFVLWREVCKQDIAQTNKILSGLLDYFIKTSFGHHGLPPKESTRGGNQVLRVAFFFDKEDITAAQNLSKDCLLLMGDLPRLPPESKTFKRILKEISWNIAGLIVLCDWIGSNAEYFDYINDINKTIPLNIYWEEFALPQALTALSAVGWEPNRVRNFSGIDSMVSLFPFIKKPTPLQTLASEMPFLDGPKLFIVEDVTGAGKTEAATILAARIMSSGDADGIYIGLPTMATANAMYDRMKEAYIKLYEKGERPSLVLSHGARHLFDGFTKTVVVHEQRIDHSYGTEETASAMCNEWYADNRKKALLADVGVGTIDQALLGVLPARHQSLRLLGLQRKILIVDEVHAYDPYMEHLLSVLLEAHARGGGSVILLSATIPQKKRNDLLKAFRKGLSEDKVELCIENEQAFPLVTQVGLSTITVYPIDTREEVRRKVGVSFFTLYEEILQLVEQKACAGECVCWIRNTVKDARKTFYDLGMGGNISIERLDLFHSRFAMVDRARIEKNVMNNFGMNSNPAMRKGRVLIATQVVEQSLDLDFDVMITDLAPIDLIIQRAGRLHRHIRDQFGKPIEGNSVIDGRSEPIVYIFAPQFDLNADKNWLSGDFAGTAAVYRDVGNLWRTHKVLLEKKGWNMPEDARELIEAVYGDGNSYDVPEGLIEKVIRAEGEEQSKRSMGHLNALILSKGYCRNAVKADQWNEDERIPTRLAEDNTEVVLAVSENGKLIPYVETAHYAWDWSCLSISLRDWEMTNYVLPGEYQSQVDELKASNSRLKFTQVVIVSKRSGKAFVSDQPISTVYDPHLGWGEILSREE